MDILLPVMEFIQKTCLGEGRNSRGKTERGAWQQNNQSKSLVTTKGGSLTMWKPMKVLLFAVIVVIGGLVAGCTKELVESDLQSPEAIPSPQVTTGDEQKTGELLAWEKARYDYSYLEGKVEEANQYLKTNKLNLEDLEQLHEIGNLLFGEALSELMMDFQHRSLKLLDDKLFINEYAKNSFYALLMMDFHDDTRRYSLDKLKETPDIRIMTNHIGERNGWVFIPVRVYFPAPSEFANDPSFDENGGNDTRWRYYVLQLRRTEHSPYHWEISYHGQVVNRGIDGEILRNDWYVTLNFEDDFSPERWKKDYVVPEDTWKYYIGERACPPRPNESICPQKTPVSLLRRVEGYKLYS